MPKKLKTWTKKYGLISHCGPMDAWQWEKEAFLNNQTVGEGGLGKFGHLKEMLKFIKPDLEWNPWLERQLECVCDDSYAHKSGGSIKRVISWTGCATAGKTFAMGLYAFAWWIADPDVSAVVLTTTTGKMGKKRMWPVIEDCFASHRNALSDWTGWPENKIRMPNLIGSQMILQAIPGNSKNSISMIAVADGDVTRAANDIKGQHAPRVLVVIDEMESTSEAIVKAAVNLEKACQDYTFAGLGNSSSMLDSHGVLSEPEKGWDEISVDSEWWKTKASKDVGMTGICLHFDGFKSPNVLAGRTIYPYLYTWEDYQKCQTREETIEVWQHDRGFWAPEGIRITVMTPQMVNRCNGRGRLQFFSNSFAFASMDPAFGGNDCVYKSGRMGDLNASGKMGIMFERTEIIKAKATSESEVDRQIALRFIELCREDGVTPDHAALDASGTGRGVYSHVYSEWSFKVHRIEFGGACSDLSVSFTDPREAKEVYDRKVTELWFSAAEFLQASQLGGLDDLAIGDFCARKFSHDKKKYNIETKEEFKKRSNGKSPDHGDTVAIAVELAKRLGGVAGGFGKNEKAADRSWDNMAKRADSIYNDEQMPPAIESDWDPYAETALDY